MPNVANELSGRYERHILQEMFGPPRNNVFLKQKHRLLINTGLQII